MCVGKNIFNSDNINEDKGIGRENTNKFSQEMKLKIMYSNVFVVTELYI